MTISIPVFGTYRYSIDWGDGAQQHDLTGTVSHTYASAGSYQVKISGVYPRIYIFNSGDRNKLLSVDQWGSNPWTSMASAFSFCSNMNVLASDAPDLSNATDLSEMFENCSSLDQGLSNWDVGQVTNMSRMFQNATSFNGLLNSWDVGQVNNMSNMFNGAAAFNQALGLWDVGNVSDMTSMFVNASMFDQALGGWDLNNVTNMDEMLDGVTLSVANYDDLLIGWSVQSLPSGVFFLAGNSQYCAGAQARQDIMSTFGWAFFDGGPGSNCATTVRVKAFLQGPYNSSTGLMHDSLRSQGLLPMIEPYTGLGWAHVIGGGETTPNSTFDVVGNDAIVDWVFLQLRDKSNNTLVVETRTALIQRDGDIVDTDGTSPVAFTSPADDYFIALFHRNHLGAMTLNTVNLSSTPSAVDLTDGSTPTYGTGAQANVSGTHVFWSGDVTSDGVVQYTGSGNDRDPILVEIGGSVPTNTTTGYMQEDVNMNGTIQYTGAGNDRDPILVNIGGSVPTNTRLEQMP